MNIASKIIFLFLVVCLLIIEHLSLFLSVNSIIIRNLLLVLLFLFVLYNNSYALYVLILIIIHLLSVQLYNKNFCAYYICILLTYFYKLKFEERSISFDLLSFISIFCLIFTASQLYYIVYNYVAWKYVIRFILTDLAISLGCYLFTVAVLLQFNRYPKPNVS